MAITLGTLALPDGLIWSDEQEWSPIDQETSYSLTGALIVEEAAKLAGRPITLAGQTDGLAHTAWISRANLSLLRAALDTPLAQFTLTLHDGRTFSVIPRRDGNGPLDADPLPAVKSFFPGNPDASYLYLLKAVRLLEV